MRHLLLAASVATALAACGNQSSEGIEGNEPPPPAITSLDDVELIPREALFGNPERAFVQISPDGRYLSWIAPVDGVLNIWVAPADDPAQARAVTGDKARGIRNYAWSHRPDTLLYLRDTGGDEDFHLYSVDVASGESRDLSPYEKTRAMIAGISHRQPDAILVGMNDRDPQWHDLYRVDLASGVRTLVEENSGRIAAYFTDADYTLRYASRAREDGGVDVLRRDGNGWVEHDTIPFEDAMTTSIGGLTTDSGTLYMLDSRDRNTSALYAIDTASGERTLLHEDPRADLGGSLSDPRSGEVQAVSVNYLREDWAVLDPSIAADLDRLAAIGPGEASVYNRTLDDRTWIVAYTAAETPVVYYRYDRDGNGGGKLTRLFSARPALDGKPLVPMWPQEIASRDGKTLVSYLTLPAHADTNADGKPDAPTPSPTPATASGPARCTTIWSTQSNGRSTRA